MKSTALLTVLLASASLALASVSETITKNFPIAPDGSLKLTNVNGSIKISTWDKNEIAVVAEKEAPDQEELDRLSISFDISPSSLDIETKHARKWFGNSRGKVSYKIQVPASLNLDKISSINSSVTIDGVHGNIKANTVNGSMHVKGAEQNVELSTINGALEVKVAKIKTDGRIVLDSVNGACTVRLPEAPNATLDASTVNGGVQCDYPVTIHSSGRNKIQGTMGNGNAKIRLHSVNGALRIEKI